MNTYIYQNKDWPNFLWDAQAIISILSRVRNKQGLLTGKMEALGFNLQSEAYLESLSQDVIKSSEIEGEILNTAQVRSSIARKLGINIGGLVDSDRNVDGIVEMMLDATQNWQSKLSADRLYGWHAALFPTGRSGIYKINVGSWRDNSKGPMQVISGPMGNETIHFEAPKAKIIPNEMKVFMAWINKLPQTDAVLKAAIAHLWFLTIHPFEDGNGRIARAITDLLLCRSEQKAQRFYSISAQIKKQRKTYYEILESSQKKDLDITAWLLWFLDCMEKAIDASSEIVQKIMSKHKFWDNHKLVTFNDRQIKILEILLSDFFGNLTTSKWAKLNKCSTDTALRDIQDLMDKNILTKSNSGGRSTNYELIK